MKRYFLLLLLLGSAVAGNAYEKITVHAVDQDGQPIEGANVAFTCHYDDWGTDRIYTAELSQTNVDGLSQVVGGGGTELCALRQPISANVTYFGETVVVSGTWKDGVNALTAIIPNLYSLDITVRDQDGTPINEVELRATLAESGEGQPFAGKTDENGILVFEQIPAGTNLLLYLTNGDETKSSIVTMENADTKFATTMNTHDLTILVSDAQGTAIGGMVVKITRDGYSNTSETDGTGSVYFDSLKPGSYSYGMTFQNRGYAGDIMLDQDKAETVVVGPQKAVKMVSPPNATNATNSSSKWFRYLMGELDGLILEQKQKAPRMRLVFVPIGYTQNESGEFKAMAQASVDRFLEVSPLRECDNPSAEIETYFMEPSACNISGCSDICGEYNNLSDNCQFLIKKCSQDSSNPYKERFDVAIGLCKNNSCGTSACGCAKSIPSTTIAVNAVDCGSVPVPKVVSHEAGHALGLFHVKSTAGLNGCWDGEDGACLGPNAADCSESAEDISRMIMAYCPAMGNYGPKGYEYLKTDKLRNYSEVCK